MDLRVRRDAEVEVLSLPALRLARRPAHHGASTGRPRGSRSLRPREGPISRQGAGHGARSRTPEERRKRRVARISRRDLTSRWFDQAVQARASRRALEPPPVPRASGQPAQLIERIARAVIDPAPGGVYK